MDKVVTKSKKAASKDTNKEVSSTDKIKSNGRSIIVMGARPTKRISPFWPQLNCKF